MRNGEMSEERKIIRVSTAAQRAGAYYVRIQTMAVKNNITLEEEIDGHDETDARHVIILDGVLPVATGRMFPENEEDMQFGRVVVLPEYRHQGLGSRVVRALEEWAVELGYRRAVLPSIVDKVEFYEQLGYTGDRNRIIREEPFDCVLMQRQLIP